MPSSLPSHTCQRLHSLPRCLSTLSPWPSAPSGGTICCPWRQHQPHSMSQLGPSGYSPLHSHSYSALLWRQGASSLGKRGRHTEVVQVRKGLFREGVRNKAGSAKESHGSLSLPQPRQRLTQGLEPSMPGPSYPFQSCPEWGEWSVGSLLPLPHRLWLMPLVTCSIADGGPAGWAQGPPHLCLLPDLVLIFCS